MPAGSVSERTPTPGAWVSVVTCADDVCGAVRRPSSAASWAADGVDALAIASASS